MLLKILKTYMDVYLYIVLTAISFVYIDKLGDSINPIISLFFMILIATIWFHLININYLRKMYYACIHDVNYLGVSISVATMWLASIYAPHYSDPFIYLSVYFTIMAIAALLTNYIQSKQIHNIISSIILILLIGGISYFYRIDGTRSIFIGVVLGGIGGLSSFVYAIFSKRITFKSDLSSTQILAVRFIPLCIILIGFIKFQNIPINLTKSNFIMLLIMGFLSLIIPIYFFQNAINKLGAIKCSFAVAFTPIAVYICYSIAHGAINIVNLIISFIVFIGLVMPKFLFKRKG